MERLSFFLNEIKDELQNNILNFWIEHAIDHDFGGFYGQIYNNNRVNKFAPKASLQNYRTLWTFAAAYDYFKQYRYMDLAHRSYNYNKNFFIDNENGGVYWMIDYNGKPENTKKHVYSNAFAILGLSEYFLGTGKQEALNEAIMIFRRIENHAHDNINKGYHESFSFDWERSSEYLFSGLANNASKSMNTHLHLLEAYTNLYKGWQNIDLKKRIKELVTLFMEHCYNADTKHLNLYFTEDWQPVTQAISYGHDIEAVILLKKAISTLGDETLKSKIKKIAIELAYKTVQEGIAEDGSIINLVEEDGTRNTDKYWWQQIEAMAGLIAAYQSTNDMVFYDSTLKIWEFCKQHFSMENGEWYCKIDEHYIPYNHENKIGPWKSAYHSTRAIIELLKYL